MKFFFIFFIFLSSFCSTLFGQCSDSAYDKYKKIAILIGEDNYEYSDRLFSSVNNVYDLASSLKMLKFDVISLTNVNQFYLLSGLKSWKNKLKDYDVALFYFSGEGFQYQDTNYVIATDAHIVTQSDIHNSAIPYQYLINLTNYDNLLARLFFFDVSFYQNFKPKNKPKNPSIFNESPSSSAAVIKSISEKGVYLIKGFTDLGQFVNRERNTAFTEAVLRNISIPNLSLNDFSKNIVQYLKDINSLSTNKLYSLAYLNSLEFYFNCKSLSLLKNTDTLVQKNIDSIIFNGKNLLGLSFENIFRNEIHTDTSETPLYDSLSSFNTIDSQLIRCYIKNINKSVVGQRAISYFNKNNFKKNITLSSSTVGIKYQLYRGTTPVGLPVEGTGALLDFGINPDAGVYTITGTDKSTVSVRNTVNILSDSYVMYKFRNDKLIEILVKIYPMDKSIEDISSIYFNLGDNIVLHPLNNEFTGNNGYHYITGYKSQNPYCAVIRVLSDEGFKISQKSNL